MKNPWEDIALDDYENHMQLESVMQLQAMNQMMKKQFELYPVHKMMILGIAGGNGLEHIRKNQFHKIYGVDVNTHYLQVVSQRYHDLGDMLECLCVDLLSERQKLPHADMIIANLLIEYIGYDCFQDVIKQVKPKIVSCIIQVNAEETWVSQSPYLHVFDKLEDVHYQIEETELEETMNYIHYQLIHTQDYLLPNGKKLVQMDYEKQINI